MTKLRSDQALLLFLAGLHSVLRKAGTALATAALAAGLLDLALFASAAVASSITATIGSLDASAATGAVIKAVDGILPLAIAIAGLARAVLLLCGAIGLRRIGLAGRGLTRFGFIAAGISALGVGTFITAPLFPLTELGMILTWVWIAVLGARLPARV